jgi:hypothetical protein
MAAIQTRGCKVAWYDDPGLSSVDGFVVFLQAQMQHTLVTVHIVVAILGPDDPLRFGVAL